MKLVILITSLTEKGLMVAQAWQDAGAPGITIVRSYGLHTLQRQIQKGQIELPRMVMSMASAMASVMDSVEERNELILSLVEDDMVDKLIEASQSVLGNLMEPENGILFTIDVERAIGLRDPRKYQ